MAEAKRPVFVEEVQWLTVLPWLRLFRSFRMAIHPPKLLMALILVVLIYLCGRVIDAAFGPQAYDGEVAAYRLLPADEFAELIKLRDAKSESQNDGVVKRPKGVFETALEFDLEAFDRLVGAATSLRFGFSEVLRGPKADPNTVAGAIRDMIVVTPGWLYHHHRGFMFIYGATCLLLFGIFGGAISRLAALHATGCAASSLGALRFAIFRLFWFLLTPVFPLIVVGLLGLLMLVGGFVFFNIPGLDILGGLVYFIALFFGLLIAMLLLMLAAGGHMFYPALAVEGTDTFDAVSRSFGYVIGKPWHWLFYTMLSIVYGAATYLFVGAVIFLSLLATHHFVSMGVVAEAAEGVSKYEAITQSPRLGQLIYSVDWEQQTGFTGRATAGLIWVWVFLLTASLGAFAISFYFSANTWIYLLLRRSNDGTAFDEIHQDRHPARPAPAPEKVEPEQENKDAEAGDAES